MPAPIVCSRLGLLLLLLNFLPLQGQAQTAALAPELQSYSVPADLSRVHFYLVTVDVGNSVWDNFGHTMLRVLDENNNTDTVFNWGVFDVSGGVVGFSWNFFQGYMRYRLSYGPAARTFASYRDQGRTVWQERINLTNPQKAVLYRRLLWNMEPENIFYDYQYFFDNCTTRVRDYLDEALGGQLHEALQLQTDVSFREQVRAHYRSVPLIELSLDVLMNSNIDRPMTAWEEMFLPMSLRQRLSEQPSAVAEQGERLMLLSDPQVIMEFPPPRAGTSPYRAASVGLLAPTLLLMLLLKRIPMSYFATHSRIGLKAAGLSFRIMGLLGVVTALFSGVYGSLMLGGWFVSGHLDLHHNVNLLLFWPTDLLGLIVALRWLLFCRPWPMTHNSAPFINYYLMAHVLGMLIYGGLALGGGVAQEIDRLALNLLPGFFLYTILIWLVGFEPAKPKNMFF